jgi:uncharacterized Zn-binding protein involved in type VI secretion
MAAILAIDAVLLCDHGGNAVPDLGDPRVLVDGAPVAVLSSIYLVSGCSNGPPPLLPCVSGTFITSATRVTASGLPVLLADSVAVCVPTGTGLMVVANQVQVNAA